MRNYTLRKLEKEDVVELKFMVQIHESMPGAWIDNYIIDYESVEKNIKKLIKRHEKPGVLCSVAENDKKVIGFVWQK